MVSNKTINKNSLILKLNLERLGKILFNYSIIGLILSFSPFMSLAVLILIWLVAIILMFLTLFIILISKDFRRGLGAISNTVTDISANLLNYLPLITSVTIFLSISSIILLSLNKSKPHRPRKIFSIIIIIIEAILLIISIKSGMNKWKNLI